MNRHGYAPALEPIRVMVDVETTGVKPGCRVWQIGAVVINSDLELRDTFSATANLCGTDYRRDDRETLKWQEQYNATNWKEAKSEVLEEHQILADFRIWLGRTGYVELWAQGDMDFPVLEAAMAHYGMAAPWSYRAVRDSRTIFKWYGVKLHKDSQSHNALIDAHRQASLLARCRKIHLFNQTQVTPDILGD